METLVESDYFGFANVVGSAEEKERLAHTILHLNTMQLDVPSSTLLLRALIAVARRMPSFAFLSLPLPSQEMSCV